MYALNFSAIILSTLKLYLHRGSLRNFYSDTELQIYRRTLCIRQNYAEVKRPVF